MKKIVLSLAGALSAIAFAPEASAIPAFARQTGLACNACHFQHFPLLNSFGRAFKSSGFTMIGAQSKVEGEHLSIPSQLNISALATMGYQRNKGAIPAANTILTPGNGGELSLFFGGRVSENIGFMSELAFTGAVAPGSSVGIAAKMPMLWDVGNNVRAGLVGQTQGPGPSYGYEVLNTGAARAHRLMGNPGPVDAHINVTSAFQYLGTQTAANGFSVIATSDKGFVNIGKYAIAAPAGVATDSNTMNSTYARGVLLFEAGGWDSAVGIMNISGKDVTAVGAGLGADTRATVIDGQIQGEAGGMPLGLYVSYGTAPTSIGTTNIYNAGATGIAGDTSRRSFNIAGELGIIPHKSTLQLAFRSGKTGVGTNAAAGQGDGDNAIMLGATYELAQNVEVSLTHTSNSGSAWNAPVGGTEPPGKNATTLLLEALF